MTGKIVGVKLDKRNGQWYALRQTQVSPTPKSEKVPIFQVTAGTIVSFQGSNPYAYSQTEIQAIVAKDEERIDANELSEELSWLE